MIVYGENITIHRGEDFTIDFSFTNKDGSPFIVSADMTHPYYLVSIVSDVFNTDNTYEYNVWCDLSKTYRFHDTNAFAKDYAPTGNTDPVNDWTEPEDFDEVDEYGNYVNKATGIDGEIYYTGCIYYSNATGKYYIYKYNDSAYSYVDVSTLNINKLVLQFSTLVTDEWSGQNYSYSIRLVETDEEVKENSENPTIIISIPMLSKGTISVLESIGGNN